MNWQIKYALENLNKGDDKLAGEYIGKELIKLSYLEKPSVLAIISATENIDINAAIRYHQEEPKIDFLCGYRKTCVWEGLAIAYLEENNIGWGSFGTLTSAVIDGRANTAAHKEFFFSDRLIRQTRIVQAISREFDRVYSITLQSGCVIRLGMIRDYEVTADTIRSFWGRFGRVDVLWSINPNGNPTQKAIEAAYELGCEVLKWEDLKTYMKNR